MSSKLSSAAKQKLAALEEGRRKWSHVHGLVERAATQPTHRDAFIRQCRRAADDVSRLFSNAGLGILAAGTNELVLSLRMAGNFSTRVGSMRDIVASVNNGIQRAERAIYQAEKPTS